MANIPEELKYSKDHEWVLVEDDVATPPPFQHGTEDEAEALLRSLLPPRGAPELLYSGSGAVL